MNKYSIYRNNIEGDKFARLLSRIEIGDYRLERYNEDIKSKEMRQCETIDRNSSSDYVSGDDGL